MARDAFAAEAALAATRGTITVAADDGLRDVLAELIHAAGLVRRNRDQPQPGDRPAERDRAGLRGPGPVRGREPAPRGTPGCGRRARAERAAVTSQQVTAAVLRAAAGIAAGQDAARDARTAFRRPRRIIRIIRDVRRTASRPGAR